MSGFFNNNANANDWQVIGSDGNDQGAAQPVAEFGTRNEEIWLAVAFDHGCRLNSNISHDNSDQAMTGMDEAPSSSSFSSSNTKNEEQRSVTNYEDERVILHWDDTLNKFVQGFRPGHKMVRWDAEKKAYVACYGAAEEQPPHFDFSKMGEPPVFHYNKQLRACVQGGRMDSTMIWWDSEYKCFTWRLTERVIEAFEREKALKG